MRRERRAAGLTQKEYARIVGIQDRSQLSRIERGERSPTLDQLIRYSIMLDMPIGKLLPKQFNRALNALWEEVDEAITVCGHDHGDTCDHRCVVLQGIKTRIEAVTSEPNKNA